jgi:hypothetical protein
MITARLKLVAAPLFAAGVLCAQPPKPLLGTVTGFKVDSLELGVRPDDGKQRFIKFGASTEVVQIPPGEQNLSKATPAKVTDITPGDRVLVSFVEGLPDARRIVLVSSIDIAKRNEAERLDWQTRGISGVVSSKSATEITLESRSSEGATLTIVVITARTKFRRYAPDSVKFADAGLSTISEIVAGDQLRTRGEKDGETGKLIADDVVFGTFLTRLGPITSIDRDAKEITIDDLTTRKPITIRFSPDTCIKKMADMHGGSPSGAPQHASPGPGGPMTVAQILERLPAGNFEDLKTGGSVVVTSTRGVTPDRATAIMVVTNVDGLIQFAQSQAAAGASPMEALGRMHGGMMSGPGGFSLPAIVP